MERPSWATIGTYALPISIALITSGGALWQLSSQEKQITGLIAQVGDIEKVLAGMTASSQADQVKTAIAQIGIIQQDIATMKARLPTEGEKDDQRKLLTDLTKSNITLTCAVRALQQRQDPKASHDGC